MFRNQYNKMGLQCIVVLLALMINGCSFYKVSVENNNVKQEYERVEMLRKTSQLEKKDIKKLTYLYFGNDTLVFPDSLYQFQYEKLDAYFYGEYGMDLYCSYGRNGLVTTMQDIAILLREKKFLKFYIA